jgi:hypothetical protein
MKEQELVKLILQYLNLKGHFCWRNNTGAVKSIYTDKHGKSRTRMWWAGIKGASDILGVLKGGKFLAIECKIGKNKPTIHQQNFLNQIHQRGGLAIVAYNLEDVKNKMNL